MSLPDERIAFALRGRYDIERELGRGGMATVWLARDRKHDRTVAVKVLHRELAAALGSERFLREVQITARLSHPHVLPLLDSGGQDDTLYYVMPYIDGESLRDRMDREGQLPVDECLTIAREVADALHYAHSQGVVHRDVKPENILLHGGHAVVADFGIARALEQGHGDQLTATGTSIGTPIYMSPEQAHGERDLDGRSDQYSLACVLYEMLVGEPPFTGPTPMAVTARKLTEPAPPLRSRRAGVTAHSESVITRALSRSAADRYGTMADFRRELDVSRTSGETPAASATQRPWMMPLAVGAAMLVALAGWQLWPGANSGTSSESLSSVAVLPFANLSSDTAQAYFAEGLTDEIVTSLSSVQGVRVASRTSTSYLVAQGADLATVAERLGVEAVVEGSVRASGDSLRIAARLVGAKDGYPIWSRTFDRTSADAFRIQEEIAQAIVAALTGGLENGASRVASTGTSDPVAYDLYLQARAMRVRQTQQTLRRSADYYTQSLALAPDFARAHAGLAEVRSIQGFYEFEPPTEVFPAAAAAAETAIRLEPRLGSAYSSRAYVALYHDWDTERAEREFKRAIDVEPENALAHQWYANLLTVTQRFDEAEAEFQRARALDPAYPVRNATLIWVQYYRRDFAKAEQAYRRALESDSTYALTFLWGSMALEALGNLEEAQRAAERSVMLSNDGVGFVASLARIHALRGDRAQAEALLSRVSEARVVPAYDVAKIELALGRKEQALRWLQRAFDDRSRWMVMLRVDPQLDALRGDPRFEALVNKVGV